MPSLSTVDDAARRRFNIVPFVHKPQQPDPNLSDKLKQEYPAILQWMIAGCIDWQKNGLVRPDVVSQATCEYFEDQDLLGKWLEEKCETGSGKHAKASELYKSWQDYAASNGEEPGSQKAFGS